MSVGSAFALGSSNSSNRSSVRSALTRHQSLPAMLPDAPPPPEGWTGPWPPPPPPLPPPPPKGHVGPWKPPGEGSSEGAPSNVKADAESDLEDDDDDYGFSPPSANKRPIRGSAIADVARSSLYKGSDTGSVRLR